jgi:anti-sigma B factor antagonist
MNLTARWPAPGMAIVHVGGEIDTLTAPALQRAAEEQLTRRPAVLVIDMGKVTFFGACGVVALIATRDAAEYTRTSVRVVGANRTVLRVLAMLGLSGLVERSWEADT